MSTSWLEKYTVISGEESKAKIISILKANDVGRLALFDEKYPYIVPLNHVFYHDSLILHGSFHGKKIDLINRNGYASYETDYFLENGKEKELSCFREHESVVLYGEIRIITDISERYKYLKAMVDAYDRPLKHGSEERCNAFVFRIHQATARDKRFMPSGENKLYLYDFMKLD